MPDQPKMANSPAPHAASALSAPERHETAPIYTLFFLGVALLVLILGALAYFRRRAIKRGDGAKK